MKVRVDVQWMVVILVTVLSLMNQQVSCVTSCDHIIMGNSTFSTKGEATSPDFPTLQSSTYSCVLEFDTRARDQYLELTFTDFILDTSNQDLCINSPNFLYAVSIRENLNLLTRRVRHCERPKRQVFPLNGVATVQLESRSQHLLKAFRVTYRFLPASEGERLTRQVTYESTRHNYDTRDNYQGSIKEGVDPDTTGREQWVDVVHYIKAPTGHQIVLDAAFMQDHRTTSLEIHDGATSYAEQIARSDTTSLNLYKSTQEWVYIRWFGEAGGGVTLNVDFTFFREAGSSGLCAVGYFHCTNDLCIPNKLLCNGVDNCYDGQNRNDEDPNGECQDDTSNANSCNGGNICQNSGICVGDVCVCEAGFTGSFCETFDGDGTVSFKCAEECLNGGTCSADEECQCADGYFGPHCEYVDNSGPDYTDLQHTSIMIGAFVGAVCLLSICWLIAMARKRQTDTQPQGRLQRIISVHSPEEGLRRQSTINAQSNVELPPNYSEAILCREGSFSNKNAFPRSSISSMNNRRISSSDPVSPPPSYEIVANDLEDDGGIVFRIPETVPEGEIGDENENDIESGTAMNVLNDQGNALPDVVTSQETSQNEESNPTLTRHDTPV